MPLPPQWLSLSLPSPKSSASIFLLVMTSSSLSLCDSTGLVVDTLALSSLPAFLASLDLRPPEDLTRLLQRSLPASFDLTLVLPSAAMRGAPRDSLLRLIVQACPGARVRLLASPASCGVSAFLSAAMPPESQQLQGPRNPQTHARWLLHDRDGLLRLLVLRLHRGALSAAVVEADVVLSPANRPDAAFLETGLSLRTLSSCSACLEELNCGCNSVLACLEELTARGFTSASLELNGAPGDEERFWLRQPDELRMRIATLVDVHSVEEVDVIPILRARLQVSQPEVEEAESTDVKGIKRRSRELKAILEGVVCEVLSSFLSAGQLQLDGVLIFSESKWCPHSPELSGEAVMAAIESFDQRRQHTPKKAKSPSKSDNRDNSPKKVERNMLSPSKADRKRSGPPALLPVLGDGYQVFELPPHAVHCGAAWLSTLEGRNKVQLSEPCAVVGLRIVHHWASGEEELLPLDPAQQFHWLSSMSCPLLPKTELLLSFDKGEDLSVSICVCDASNSRLMLRQVESVRESSRISVEVVESTGAEEHDVVFLHYFHDLLKKKAFQAKLVCISQFGVLSCRLESDSGSSSEEVSPHARVVSSLVVVGADVAAVEDKRFKQPIINLLLILFNLISFGVLIRYIVVHHFVNALVDSL